MEEVYQEKLDYVSGNVPASSMTRDDWKELLIEVFGLETAESVSNNDVIEELTPDSVSGNDIAEELISESVSDNSVSGNSVSSNDYMPILTDMYTEMQQPTIWDKPLEDYSVTEGLLLLMFILLLALFVGKFFKKGERHV